jgi:hypothetical protein
MLSPPKWPRPPSTPPYTHREPEVPTHPSELTQESKVWFSTATGSPKGQFDGVGDGVRVVDGVRDAERELDADGDVVADSVAVEDTVGVKDGVDDSEAVDVGVGHRCEYDVTMTLSSAAQPSGLPMNTDTVMASDNAVCGNVMSM